MGCPSCFVLAVQAGALCTLHYWRKCNGCVVTDILSTKLVVGVLVVFVEAASGQVSHLSRLSHP